MAEIQDSPSPENAAELPKTTPLPSGNAADGTKSGFIEKIRGIGERAFSKTIDAVKSGRGRGRPPGTGKNQRAEAARAAENNFVESHAAPVEVVNPGGSSIFDGDLIKTCISAIAKGACAFFKSKVTDGAMRKGASADQAERLANKCDVTGDEIESLGTFAGILLKKYNVDTQYAPEFAFGAIVTGIGLRFMTVMSEIKRLPNPEKA